MLCCRVSIADGFHSENSATDFVYARDPDLLEPNLTFSDFSH